MPLQDTLSNVENQTAHDNTATYSALVMARVVILSMAIIELLVKTKNKNVLFLFCVKHVLLFFPKQSFLVPDIGAGKGSLSYLSKTS
jgi:hypothetical protein